MRKLFAIFLIVIFPFVSIGISTRIAFTEFFIDFEYSKKDFPEDRWGLSKEYRKKLAKIGLKAVLSDEGLEEFKRAKLPDGRKAFNEREIRHMKDVKNLLSVFFPSVYSLTLLWILGTVILKDAKIVYYSGLFALVFHFTVAVLIFLNYNKAFELFHIVVFDPYSWRFKYTDTLLRIYPMKFWFDATVFVVVLSITFDLLALILGKVLKGKKKIKP